MKFSGIVLLVLASVFNLAYGEGSLRDDLMKQAGVVEAQFLFKKATFASCHASTIEETKDYFIAAFFGGTDEGEDDVCIWTCRKNKGTSQWSAPAMAADGVQYVEADTKKQKRYPCWNPVLYQAEGGKLYLFYKVGPTPRKWWGMLKVSDDQGVSWSQASRLPEGIIGPVRAKGVMLSDGRLLCGSSTEDKGWRVHMEWTTDFGKTWTRTGPFEEGRKIDAIQPTILKFSDDKLQILCRSENNLLQSFSDDGGRTWSRLTKSVLPNPSAGIDVVTLPNGKHLLVYNHSTKKTGERGRLNVAVTKDGRSWQAALKLEDMKTVENKKASGAYPAAILGSDGFVHVVYTWRRERINYVVIDPAKLVLCDMPKGHWPEEK